MNPQLILFMKIYYGAIEGLHCYNEQPDNTNPSQIIYRQPYNPSLLTQLKSIEQQNRLAYETFVEIHRTNPQLIHTYISNPFYNIYRESKYTALTLYQHYVCFFIKIYNESIKIIQFIYQNYEQLFFQPTNNLSQQSLYGVDLQLNHEFIDTYEQQYHTDLRKQELSQIKVFSVSSTQLSCLLKSLIYAYFDLFNLYYYYPQILFTEELMENPWLKEYLFKFIETNLNLTAPKYSILVSYIYQSIVEQEFNTVEELIYYCIAIIYSSDIQKHIKTLSILATFEENKLDVDIFYTYVSEIRYLLNYTYVSLHKMVFFNLNRSKLTCFLWFLCSRQNNQNLFYEPENIKPLKKTFMEVYSKVYTIVQTYDGFTNDLKKENK